MSDLSICMMVKDGGVLFRQSLESIRDFDAQVVVLVDNATVDNTAAIAEEFGAEIHYHDWPDSFAEARNRSLEFAERKWTLVLDHDERFEPADIPRIAEVLATEEDYEGIKIQTLNETAGGGTTAQFIPRFIRTGRGRYKGAKHHALIIAGNIRYAPARLYHKGYNLSPAKMKAKNERDIRLLEKQIEEEPHDTYHRRNLIRSLRSKGDTEELLKQAAELDDLVQNFQLPITDLSMQLIFLDMGSAHITDGNLDKAEASLSQLAQEFPLNPDGWFFLGCVYHSLEKFVECAEALNKYLQAIFALRQSMNPPNLIIETWTSTARAYKLMADAYLESGQWPEYQQAVTVAYVQEAQDFMAHFSSKLLTKIMRLEAQIVDLTEKPKTELILPGKEGYG